MRALISRPDSTVPELVDREPPAAGDRQLAIDLIASAINPVDQFVSAGRPPAADHWQDIRRGFGITGTVGLGWDVVGTVAAVGAKVRGYAVGDLVAGLHANIAAPTRAHADRVVLDASAVAQVPRGLDPVAAASMPLTGLTAATAMRTLGDGEGRTLLITGAAGAVGGHAAALAVAAGWAVTGLARADDADFVERTGAVPVTDLGDLKWDVVLDAAVLRGRALAATNDGGRYLGVQPASPVRTDRPVTIDDVAVRPDSEVLADLLDSAQSGALELRLAGAVPLEQAAPTYPRATSAGQRGRWVLLA